MSAPAVTEREFRRTLECGTLAHGFTRARCADCGYDFLTAIEQVLRQHPPGARAVSRLGAVISIHRHGAPLNTHRHVHCIVVDGVFEADAEHSAIFHPASGRDAPAIDEVQAFVRRRLLRLAPQSGLLSVDDARWMAEWEHGGGFSVDDLSIHLMRISWALYAHREAIEGIVVESTYNTYWLVDGLMEAGYRAHRVNTTAVRQCGAMK